jgi:hypothetical protein
MVYSGNVVKGELLDLPSHFTEPQHKYAELIVSCGCVESQIDAPEPHFMPMSFEEDEHVFISAPGQNIEIREYNTYFALRYDIYGTYAYPAVNNNLLEKGITDCNGIYETSGKYKEAVVFVTPCRVCKPVYISTSFAWKTACISCLVDGEWKYSPRDKWFLEGTIDISPALLFLENNAMIGNYFNFLTNSGIRYANATTDTIFNFDDPRAHCAPTRNSNDQYVPTSGFFPVGPFEYYDGIVFGKQSIVNLPPKWSNSISDTINPICMLITNYNPDAVISNITSFTFGREVSIPDSSDLTPPTIHNAFIGVAYIPK